MMSSDMRVGYVLPLDGFRGSAAVWSRCSSFPCGASSAAGSIRSWSEGEAGRGGSEIPALRRGRAHSARPAASRPPLVRRPCLTVEHLHRDRLAAQHPEPGGQASLNRASPTPC